MESFSIEDPAMARQVGRRRLVLVAGMLVLGGVAAGLGVFLARQGLERADKSASVVGAFIGLAGLAVAVYSAWLARLATLASQQVRLATSAADQQTATSTGDAPPVGGQWVSGSVIGGDNIQIGSGGRDIQIDRD